MRQSALFIGLALALLASGGCSANSVGSRFRPPPPSSSTNEIAALKAQIVELQRRAAIADVEIQRLQKRLAELESSARRTPGGENARPETPVAAIEPPAATPPASGDAPDSSGVEVSDLPGGLAPAPEAGAGSDRGRGSGSDSDAAGAGEVLTASAQALYDRGYTLYHRGRYVDSETAFRQFLQGYSGTVLADNAQFWIAEARYARGDVEGALAAFRETAARFPTGNKAPDALLKAGDCLSELGDTQGARRSFRAVLEEFPGSAAAAAARERLAGTP